MKNITQIVKNILTEAIIAISILASSQGYSYELRYVHSHDAHYNTSEVKPFWSVSAGEDQKSYEITTDVNGSTVGGYVLIGREIELPAQIVDSRVSLEYKMSFIEPDWRNFKGHLGVALMTGQTWGDLADNPKNAKSLNFYKNKNWIYHGKLDHIDKQRTETNFVKTTSTNFAVKLAPYAGQKVYFAVIWGTTYPGKQFASVRNTELKILNDDTQKATEFFDSFRTDIKEFNNFYKAVEAKDYTLAKKALADYYRKRQRPIYKAYEDYSISEKEADSHAENAVKGIYLAPKVGVPPLEVPRDNIWTAMPQNQEQWAIAFNRHYLWKWLGESYTRHGKKEYLQEFQWELENWSETMPVSFGRFFTEGLYEEFGQLTLSLNAGLRMGQTWFHAFEHFKRDMSDEHLYIMLYWMNEHGRYLSEPLHFPAGNNWGAMATNGFFHLSFMLPELKNAKRWRQTAEERIIRALSLQIYPDGFQKELTPSYHRITMDQFLSSIKLAKYNNISLSPEIDSLIKKMYIALVKIAMPNFHNPPFNDSGSWSYNKLKVTSELYPEEKTFDYFASLRKSGSVPDFTSCELPWAGWKIMRENWDEDAKYLIFDTGPLGISHCHEDKLHFILCAYGEQLIYEMGTYMYDQSKWRRLATGPWSHNTTLVDGLGQARTKESSPHLEVNSPSENGIWQTDNDFDYACGCYSNGLFKKGNDTVRMTHQREILFVKPDYFIIIDTMVPNDNNVHKYEALFHFYDNQAEILPDTTRVKVTKSQAELDMICLWPNDVKVRIVEGQEEPVLLGWKKTDTLGVMLPSPVAVYEFGGKGTKKAVWILAPKRKTDSNLIEQVAPAITEKDDIIFTWETNKKDRDRLIIRQNPGDKFGDFVFSRKSACPERKKTFRKIQD